MLEMEPPTAPALAIPKASAPAKLPAATIPPSFPQAAGPDDPHNDDNDLWTLDLSLNRPAPTARSPPAVHKAARPTPTRAISQSPNAIRAADRRRHKGRALVGRKVQDATREGTVTGFTEGTGSTVLALETSETYTVEWSATPQDSSSEEVSWSRLKLLLAATGTASWLQALPAEPGTIMFPNSAGEWQPGTVQMKGKGAWINKVKIQPLPMTALRARPQPHAPQGLSDPSLGTVQWVPLANLRPRVPEMLGRAARAQSARHIQQRWTEFWTPEQRRMGRTGGVTLFPAGIARDIVDQYPGPATGSKRNWSQMQAQSQPLVHPWNDSPAEELLQMQHLRKHIAQQAALTDRQRDRTAATVTRSQPDPTALISHSRPAFSAATATIQAGGGGGGGTMPGWQIQQMAAGLPDHEDEAEEQALAEIETNAAFKSDNYAKAWARFCAWNNRKGYALMRSRSFPSEIIPFFSEDRLRKYAAYLLVNYSLGSLGPIQSALNHHYEYHGCGRPWQGRRLRRYSNAFATARTARNIAEGKRVLSGRVAIPVAAVKWAFNLLDGFSDAELAQNAEHRTKYARLTICLIMIVFIIRAGTMGAIESDADIYFNRHGQLVFVARSVKRRDTAQPIHRVLAPPKPEHGPGHYRARLFAIIRRAKRLQISLNILRDGDSASTEINSWIDEVWPASILDTPVGGYVASHSFRKTGATGATAALIVVEWLRKWGMWLSVASFELYIKECEESYMTDGVLFEQLFDFLPKHTRG